MTTHCFGTEEIELNNRTPALLDAAIVDDATTSAVNLTNRILSFVVRQSALDTAPVLSLESPDEITIAAPASGQAVVAVPALARNVPPGGEWLLWELRVAEVATPAVYAVVDQGVLHLLP